MCLGISSLSHGDHEVSRVLSVLCPYVWSCMKVPLTQLCLEFLWRKEKEKYFKEFGLKERKETSQK